MNKKFKICFGLVGPGPAQPYQKVQNSELHRFWWVVFQKNPSICIFRIFTKNMENLLEILKLVGNPENQCKTCEIREIPEMIFKSRKSMKLIENQNLVTLFSRSVKYHSFKISKYHPTDSYSVVWIF